MTRRLATSAAVISNSRHPWPSRLALFKTPFHRTQTPFRINLLEISTSSWEILAESGRFGSEKDDDDAEAAEEEEAIVAGSTCEARTFNSRFSPVPGRVYK